MRAASVEAKIKRIEVEAVDFNVILEYRFLGQKNIFERLAK